jgi:hypothetical protein
MLVRPLNCPLGRVCGRRDDDGDGDGDDCDRAVVT